MTARGYSACNGLVNEPGEGTQSVTIRGFVTPRAMQSHGQAEQTSDEAHTLCKYGELGLAKL
jgi:hypothetical protein